MYSSSKPRGHYRSNQYDVGMLETSRKNRLSIRYVIYDNLTFNPQNTCQRSLGLSWNRLEFEDNLNFLWNT